MEDTLFLEVNSVEIFSEKQYKNIYTRQNDYNKGAITNEKH